MLVNSINPAQPQNNTNFKSKIINNEFLNEGYKLAEEMIETISFKDLNKVKGFYDSIAKIKASKAADTVCFEHTIDSASVLADEKRTILLDHQNKNYQPGYLAIQAVKTYASQLNVKEEPTVLDACQKNITGVMEELETLKKGYAAHLKGMLNDLKNS